MPASLVEERLRRLERRHRCFVRTMLAATLVVGAFVLVGQASAETPLALKSEKHFRKYNVGFRNSYTWKYKDVGKVEGSSLGRAPYKSSVFYLIYKRQEHVSVTFTYTYTDKGECGVALNVQGAMANEFDRDLQGYYVSIGIDPKDNVSKVYIKSGLIESGAKLDAAIPITSDELKDAIKDGTPVKVTVELQKITADVSVEGVQKKVSKDKITVSINGVSAGSQVLPIEAPVEAPKSGKYCGLYVTEGKFLFEDVDVQVQ